MTCVMDVRKNLFPSLLSLPSALINKVVIVAGIEVIQKYGLSVTKASMVISIPESPPAYNKDQYQLVIWHYFSGHTASGWFHWTISTIEEKCVVLTRILTLDMDLPSLPAVFLPKPLIYGLAECFIHHNGILSALVLTRKLILQRMNAVLVFPSPWKQVTWLNYVIAFSRLSLVLDGWQNFAPQIDEVDLCVPFY